MGVLQCLGWIGSGGSRRCEDSVGGSGSGVASLLHGWEGGVREGEGIVEEVVGGCVLCVDICISYEGRKRGSS